MRKPMILIGRGLALLAALDLGYLSQRLVAQQPATAPAAVGVARAATSTPAAIQGSSVPASAAAKAQDDAMNAPLTEAQGDSFLARGRYIAAIRSYGGAEPKTAAIYNKLGIACEHMRMNDRARDSFTKALKLNPKFAEVYNNLGTLAHTEGDYKHAEKFYKQAIRLDPRSPDAEKNLGTLYYARGKYAKGDQAYRRAHELDSTIFARSSHAPIQASTEAKNTANLHYHLAKTYARAGSGQMALDYLRKAINEGFRDRKRLLTDQEFAGLWNTPAFMKIVEDLKVN